MKQFDVVISRHSHVNDLTKRDLISADHAAWFEPLPTMIYVQIVSQHFPIRRESASFGTLNVPLPCVKVISQALPVSLEKQLKQEKHLN